MCDVTLISHGPPGSGPSLMLAALGAALVESEQVVSADVVDLPESDGAAAILRLGAAAAGPDIAGSCTPTYLTSPLKQHLPITHRDLTPLAGLVSDSYLIVTRADHPRAELTTMFTEATTAAVAPSGGNTHIQALLLADATGRDVAIAIHPDLATAIDAVADGFADWTTGVATDFADHVAAGQVVVLGSFDTDGTPGPPTLRNGGIDVTFQLWRGLIGPPGLEPAMVERWGQRVRVARTTQAWQDYLAAAGLTNLDLSGSKFGDLLDAEQVNYRRWLGRLGH